MDRVISQRRNLSLARLLIVVLAALLVLGYIYFPRAYGAQLPFRSLFLSDSRTGVIATYQLGFEIPANETLGSIKLQICANDPLIGDTCTVPQGFDISSAILSGQSGATGFAILSAGTNAYTLVLTRTPALATTGNVSYTLQGVINPSNAGTYYGRLQTFATSDASGSATNSGGMAFSVHNNLQISTTVPPYLLFCSGITITDDDCSTASGAYINFGDFSSTLTSSVQTQLLTATNAASGYNLYVYGPTMTSGNNVINAMATPDVSRPGISQFGLNLVANQTPLVGENPSGVGVASPASNYDQPNFFKYTSGDVIAFTDHPSDYRQFTISYIVNVPSGQMPGVYVTSLTYLCLANF
jgi:hypothetical protein